MTEMLPGSIRGKCCFKCARHTAHGLCEFSGKETHTVGLYCEHFELDRTRYASLTVLQWQYRFMQKHNKGLLDAWMPKD